MSKKLLVAGSALSVIATASNAAIVGATPLVMPTANYTNIEAAATVGFGVVLTVGLLKKAKSFFS